MSRLAKRPGRRRDGVASGLFLDPGNMGAGMKLDAAAAHFLSQRHADIVIKAIQQLVAADQLDDLAAEPIEDTGKLDRDVTAADDHDTPRQLLQIQRLVGRDHVLDAWNIRRFGP